MANNTADFLKCFGELSNPWVWDNYHTDMPPSPCYLHYLIFRKRSGIHPRGKVGKELDAPGGRFNSALPPPSLLCPGQGCQHAGARVPLKTPPLILLPGPASRTETKERKPPGHQRVKKRTRKVQSR